MRQWPRACSGKLPQPDGEKDPATPNRNATISSPEYVLCSGTIQTGIATAAIRTLKTTRPPGGL
jgi:hypothetical protein